MVIRRSGSRDGGRKRETKGIFLLDVANIADTCIRRRWYTCVVNGRQTVYAGLRWQVTACCELHNE